MTHTPIDELRKLKDEATDGPWYYVEDEGQELCEMRQQHVCVEHPAFDALSISFNQSHRTRGFWPEWKSHEANARIIAFAPTAVSELIEVLLENARLEKELAELKAANDWVKIEDAENLLNNYEGPYDIIVHGERYTDARMHKTGDWTYNGGDDWWPQTSVSHVRLPPAPPVEG